MRDNLLAIEVSALKSDEKVMRSFLWIITVFLTISVHAQNSSNSDWSRTLKQLGAVNADRCDFQTPPPPIDDPCLSLSRPMCRPGIINDGTGSSWKGSKSAINEREKVWVEKIATEWTKNEIKTDPKFKAYLEKHVRKHPEFTKDGVVTDEELLKYGTLKGLYSFIDRIPAVAKILGKRTMYPLVVPGGEKARYERMFRKIETEMVKIDPALEIEKRLEDVKTEMVSVLKAKLPDGKPRDLMIERISKVKFEGGDCTQEFLRETRKHGISRYDLVMNKNAYYNPKTNGIKYCASWLRHNTSAFDIYFALAHEITHSIEGGLCEPDSKLTQCLRGYDSVYAQVKERKNEYLEKIGECGHNDQLTEAIPDVFGTEVTVNLMAKQNLTPEQYRAGFTNVMRSAMLCDEENNAHVQKFDPHPEVQKRLDRVVLAHPDVQRLMNCDPKYAPPVRYCGDQSPIPEITQ